MERNPSASSVKTNAEAEAASNNSTSSTAALVDLRQYVEDNLREIRQEMESLKDSVDHSSRQIQQLRRENEELVISMTRDALRNSINNPEIVTYSTRFRGVKKVSF